MNDHTSSIGAAVRHKFAARLKTISFEVPRVCGDRINGPEHHQIRPIRNLAPCARTLAGLLQGLHSRLRGDMVWIDEGTAAVRDRRSRALGLARDVFEANNQWPLSSLKKLGRTRDPIG
jgi:hypothetical protein